MRLAYPSRPRGSHKGVPLRCGIGKNPPLPPLTVEMSARTTKAIATCTRRGTPLWLPRGGAGYAKRSSRQARTYSLAPKPRDLSSCAIT